MYQQGIIQYDATGTICFHLMKISLMQILKTMCKGCPRDKQSGLVIHTKVSHGFAKVEIAKVTGTVVLPAS